MLVDNLKVARNQLFWQCWVWETSIERRRTDAIAERLERIFFISERRLNDLTREMAGQRYERPAEAISGGLLFKHLIWDVYQEVYMGGQDQLVIICQGAEVARGTGGRLEGLAMVKALEKRLGAWLKLASP